MDQFRSSATVETLRARAALVQQCRAFFDSRQFVEVQTPLLSSDTVVDRHLDPISVLLPHNGLDPLSGQPMWLQTSPEFAMKRLLASGMHAIYQITPAFRIGESGSHHNPEFTMLEWYRCGDTMLEGMSLLGELVSHLLQLPTAETTSVSDAFDTYAGIRPELHNAERSRLTVDQGNWMYRRRWADWDALFDVLFTELVQPRLGLSAPTIIYDYPASQAALAKIRDDTLPVAERFELFVGGVELANGYHELLDAGELLRRNQAVNQERIGDGKPPLPIESRLLDAMRAGLPPCVGVALGLDRLVMLATGCKSIQEVISFSIDRA